MSIAQVKKGINYPFRWLPRAWRVHRGRLGRRGR